MAAATRRLLGVVGLAGLGLLLWWLAAGPETETRAPAIATRVAEAVAPRTFDMPQQPEQPLAAVGPGAEPAAAPPVATQIAADVAPAAARDAVIRVVDGAGESVPTARIALWRGSAQWSDAQRAPDESWPVDASGHFTLRLGDAHLLLE